MCLLLLILAIVGLVYYKKNKDKNSNEPRYVANIDDLSDGSDNGDKNVDYALNIYDPKSPPLSPNRQARPSLNWKKNISLFI